MGVLKGYPKQTSSPTDYKGDITATKKDKKNALDVAVQTSDRSTHNVFDAVRTNVTTSATKIEFPESGNFFFIAHDSDVLTLWLAKESTVTVGGPSAFPLRAGERLPLEMLSGNSNELYGIVASETLNVYVGVTYKE